jgi:hypothetical protein
MLASLEVALAFGRRGLLANPRATSVEAVMAAFAKSWRWE